ncbi:nitrate ABC transporter substrate-binding protein [Opitutaceae bacterium TAV5]|nr:nitrate ABC transporter substrate-binding protein [Opitutaceae bacterium TAV5]
MSATLSDIPAAKSGQTKTAASPAVEITYTICPIYVASHVALELGWLEEEIRKAGGSPGFLRAKPDNGLHAHFSHRHDNLFRDGGIVPSIWAKADNTDTTLLALTAAPHGGGQILVRADSGIRRVADLRGRKIGLSRITNPGKIDWWRATSERGIELALALHGLGRDDVRIVDVEHDDSHFSGRGAGHPQVGGFLTGAKPADAWARLRERTIPGFVPEVQALQDGQVDAVFTNFGRAIALQRTGLFTAIEDLGRHPDWTLQVSNSPWALTVNTDLVKNHPEIVVAYLRAAIRAGRWINAHRAAAADILHRVTYPPTPADTLREITPVDFVPNLSAQNLAAAEIKKQFLLSHGYIKRDFSVKEWAAPDLLAQAHRSLPA